MIKKVPERPAHNMKLCAVCAVFRVLPATTDRFSPRQIVLKNHSDGI